MAEQRERPSLHVASDGGLVVGWHGALGPCVARFELWSRERPMFAKTLGAPGADLPSVPALWAPPGALFAFWCEEDGAHGAQIIEGTIESSRLLVPGARDVAATG